MPPVIKGSKDLKRSQASVVKGQSDSRQIRCTKCKELAVQVPDGKGGYVYQCTATVCGTRFSMTRM